MGLPFAKELVKLGHEVQALTGFPNYPRGKLYTGYRIKLFQREIMDGITVLRVPLYPSHDSSGIKRFFTYISFALSAAIIGTWTIKRPDVVYVHLSPVTTCIPACVIRLLRGTRLVYNIQDLWPDSLSASGMFQNRFGLWLVDRCCRMFYRAASRIVVLSPGFKEELCKRGVPGDRIEVIYNWCDDSNIYSISKDPALANELGLVGRFNIIFAGNMGKMQALGAVLEAAEIVQPRCPHVQFVFIGGGTEVDNLKRRAKDMRLKNVLFLERRPVYQIGSILSLADVLLVHLKDVPLFRITIPSKTQAYLAAGKPILMGVRGNAADLVTKAGAGLLCEPENPRSIAQMVLKLQAMPEVELAAMGENGKRFYEQELSLRVGVKRFEAVFRSVEKRP
jgi:colanic acid biosynthesis glycosyl transferase WcaI